MISCLAGRWFIQIIMRMSCSGTIDCKTGTSVVAASETFYKLTGMSCFGVRRAKAAFLSGCESHPAMLLQPEAIGAVMEVTKWLKPLM